MAATVDEPRPSSAMIPGQSGRLMTAEERQKVKAAIANAKTAEEIKKLERSLKEGWIPNA
jgi:U2 small nuclear ribonucleoprotein A'